MKNDSTRPLNRQIDFFSGILTVYISTVNTFLATRMSPRDFVFWRPSLRPSLSPFFLPFSLSLFNHFRYTTKPFDLLCYEVLLLFLKHFYFVQKRRQTVTRAVNEAFDSPVWEVLIHFLRHFYPVQKKANSNHQL